MQGWLDNIDILKYSARTAGNSLIAGRFIKIYKKNDS